MDPSRIEAGKLRHRINIVTPSLAQDTFGGTNPGAYSDFATDVPAAIDTLQGRELYSAQQKVSQVTHRITLRWQSGIRAKMNVVWSDDGVDRFFQVEAVENPDGRHKKLVLLCIERDDSSRGI